VEPADNVVGQEGIGRAPPIAGHGARPTHSCPAHRFGAVQIRQALLCSEARRTARADISEDLIDRVITVSARA
jgi:hypothetical protein